jgi:hypothetical protein
MVARPASVALMPLDRYTMVSLTPRWATTRARRRNWAGVSPVTGWIHSACAAEITCTAASSTTISRQPARDTPSYETSLRTAAANGYLASA